MLTTGVLTFLLDNPIGAYVVVDNGMADRIMLQEGGILYKDSKHYRMYFEPLSPGTGALSLRHGRENETRGGIGPCVYLSEPDID